MPVLPIDRAADMSFDPSACVVLTAANLQAALLEVDTELAAISSSYQPLDGDLSAIAALTGTNTLYYRQAANTWAAVTIGGGLSFSGGTLQTSGVLLTANNLSELTATAATARTNLGLGTMAVEAASTYLTVAAAAAGYQPLDGDLSAIAALTGTNTLYYRSAINTWSAVTIGGGLSFSGGTLATSGGITSLGGETAAIQTFQTSTAGTDFVISSAGGVHTFGLPDASATARGLITTETQTFAGAKTFGTLSATSLTLTQNQWIGWTGGVGNLITGDLDAVRLNNVGIRRLTQLEFGSTTDVVLVRDAAGVLSLRNSTNAQTFNIANTYTSSTNFEYGRLQWASNEFRLGTAVGSAGGVQRSTVIGSWNSAGSWTAAITIATTGVVTFGNTINISAFSGMVMGSDVTFARDAARTLELRSSTSAITFALSNTYTSGTIFEQGKFQWVTNEWRIGTAVGSGGGTQRTTAFGLWDSAGAWTASFSVDSSANLNISDARSLVFGTTTGTKIGTATTQKLGFWNATPVVQPASANQAALTDSTTGSTANTTLVDVGAIFSQVNINDNFAKVAKLVNQLRSDLVLSGLLKGSA